MIKRIWIFVIVMLGGLVSCADPIDYSQAEPFVTAGYSGDSGLMPMRDGIKQFNTIHQGHKGYQYEDDGVEGWYHCDHGMFSSGDATKSYLAFTKDGDLVTIAADVIFLGNYNFDYQVLLLSAKKIVGKFGKADKIDEIDLGGKDAVRYTYYLGDFKYIVVFCPDDHSLTDQLTYQKRS